MNHTNTIQHILHAWGHLARETPPHNEKLKNETLAHLIASSPVHIRTISPIHFPWASLALAGFALFAVVMMPTPIDRHAFSPEQAINRESITNISKKEEQHAQMQGAEPMQYKVMDSAPFVESTPSFDASDKEFIPKQEVPITDPREYLKTDYRAEIYTHSVQELAQRIQTTVRRFDGRVDGLNTSPKYGFMRFVIPARQFDAFQNEITNLAGKRFLIEDIYTENLLSQKQSIEQSQENAKKIISQLNTDRTELIAAHGHVLAAIHAQLAAYVYELNQLKREVTSDAVRQTQIAARIQWLLKEEKIVNVRLQSENADYSQNLQSLDARIRYAKNGLEFVNTQDKELLHTVATVRGTISLHWISWWQFANFYIPFPWIPILLAGTAIATYSIGRRRNRLIIS